MIPTDTSQRPRSPMPNGPPAPDDFPDDGPNSLASFTQRAWARSADAAMTFFATFLVFSVVLVVMAADTLTPDGGLTAETERLQESVAAFVAPAWLVLAAIYELVAVAWRGRTVGKWALGVRVARYTNGTTPTWSQSALRALLPAAGGVMTLALLDLPALGVFAVLATAYASELRRGWHDIAGGTVVVRTR